MDHTRRSKPLVLLIDDEMHIQHVISLTLHEDGYEVVTAEDGEEGLEMAIRLQPDLVVTDNQMPFMTGVEMSRKLMVAEQTSTIPVLLLTARGCCLNPEETAMTNIAGVVYKPFSPREIGEQVKMLIAKARVESN